MTSTRSIKNLQRDRKEESTLPASVLGQRKQLIEEPPVEAPPPSELILNNEYDSINLKFDFDDVLILPSTLTSVDSRYKDINPFVGDTLPLFTAPMDTVIDRDCLQDFTNNKINIILPRTDTSKKYSFGFNSFSLSEFESLIPTMSSYDGTWRVLLDIANGHMKKVLRYATHAKKRNSNIIIMAGNIANPETYREYCESGVIDYARIGIGNGNGCLTTQQTGIGYPMGSLIAECNVIKEKYENKTKIVADGGMKKYSDIIKALALGADYVMVGSIFNKALESASKNYWHGIPLSREFAKILFNRGYTIHKEFRGMSSKKSQQLLGNKTIRTSEGVIKKQKVEYTLQQWTENFEHYLRSAMSYTNSKTLNEFIGKVKFNIITQNSQNRFNK